MSARVVRDADVILPKTTMEEKTIVMTTMEMKDKKDSSSEESAITNADKLKEATMTTMEIKGKKDSSSEELTRTTTNAEKVKAHLMQEMSEKNALLVMNMLTKMTMATTEEKKWEELVSGPLPTLS